MKINIPIKKIIPRLRRFFRFAKRKQGFKYAIIALLIFVVSSAFFVFNPFAAKAAWWNDSWLYRQIVKIDNSGGEQANVKLNITLDTAALITAGKMRADCGDMRFTKNSGEALPYYLASGCNATNTSVWLKFDILTSSDTSIYFYYGNARADSDSVAMQFNVSTASSATAGSAKNEEKGPAPSLFLPLNENHGITAADTVGGHDGTISGASWLPQQACVSGNCLAFDGVNDSIAVSGTVPGVQTVVFWVKTASTSASFLDLNGTANISATNNAISANNLASPTIYINGNSGTTLINGQWNMIAITTNTATTASSMLIGKINSSYYAGYIDEIKLYPYVRTQKEIKLDYSMGQAGFSSRQGSGAIFGENKKDSMNDGLIARYKMNENSWSTTTNSAIDSSQFQNNARPFDNASTTASGKFSRSGNFDGSGDYLNASSTPLMSDTGEITISSWINPSDTITATSGVIQDLIDDGTHRVFMDTDGTLKFTIDSDTPERFTNEKGETEFGGLNGTVYAMATYNGELYVGGDFKAAGGVFGRDNIAKWDGKKWNTVGAVSDINSTVRTLATYNGSLYVGGDFTNAAGTTNRNYIARWNGSTWNTVGAVSDINSTVYTLATYNGSLYVGGDFTNAAGTTNRNYITSWDGSTWNTVGAVSNINSYVNTLAVYNGSLYVGGNFTNAAGTTNRNYIARWDGSSWNTVGAVSDINSTVYALVTYNGSLFLGGQFQPFLARYSSINDLSVTTAPLSSLGWQNFSAVYDGYSARIYIDGVLFGETIGSIRPKAVSQTDYFIGAGFGTSFPGANEPFFAGQMDDTRIYNRALNSSEITSLYRWSPEKYVHLKMDERQGVSLYDASGNNIQGTSSGATWVDGKINSGLSLDGINDQLLITNYEFPVANQFSVNQWFNFQTLAAGKPLISHWGNSNNNILVKTSDLASDEITVCVASSGTDNCTNGATTTVANIGANTWYHIHVAYDGSQSTNAGRLKIYINGAEQTLSFTGTIPATMQNVATNLELGGDADLGVYSNVILDDFSVYSYARTQAQGIWDMRGCDVSGDYCQVNDPSLHYALDDGRGTVARDSQGAYHGVISGATWPTPDKCLTGSCLSLDGINDEITYTGTVPGIQTISFWAKTASSGSVFLDLNGTADISISNNTISANNISSPSIYVNGGPSTTIIPGQWNLITITTDVATSAINMSIGKIDSNYYKGYIDEIKLFPYARSEKEIREDYSAGLRGMASRQGSGATFGSNRQGALQNGLIAHYQMNENSWSTTTNSVIDSSIYQNDARPSEHASTTADGKYSRAGIFDGYGDNLTASSAPLMSSTGEITISSWINPSDTITATSGVIQDLIDDGTHRVFMDTDGTLKFTIDSDTPERFTNEKGEAGFRGLDGAVYAMATYNGELYVGGVFTNIANVTGRNYIAKWDGVKWHTVGALNDINGEVKTLASYNGSLYVGGDFTNVAGITNRNYIARWDGVSWNTVGAVNDINLNVKALAVYNGSLYVGGSFTNVAGVTNRNYIARWDSNNWNTVGAVNDINNDVYAFAVYSGSLYVGGAFISAAGVTNRNSIARWNGSTWNTVGAVSNINNIVIALAVYNGSLYVGGNFTNVAGTTGRNYIARWNGSAWNTVGAVNDINLSVKALAVYNGSLYVGGSFTNVAGVANRNRIARWNSSTWNTVGAVNDISSEIYAFSVYKGALYVGGYFTNAGGVTNCSYIALWDGNFWNIVGTASSINRWVNTLIVYKDSLYVGGAFTNTAGINGLNYIARWDGYSWKTVGNINDINGIVVVFSVYKNSLYVGGNFTNTAGVANRNYIARWDGTNWNTVGAVGDINDVVNAFTIYNDSLYVGGDFTNVSSTTNRNYITSWDGSTWNTVGAVSDINDSVNALATYNSSLYVGGDFTNAAGTTNRNRIARWDGSTWNTVGAVSDINSTVYTLATYNGSLYVGGNFTSAAGVTNRNYIARWNGSVWNTVGAVSNINDIVYTLATYNGSLYVGGDFTNAAGTINRNYIARWDGSAWNTVGAVSDINDSVYTLATYNGSLYVGGNFQPFFARYSSLNDLNVSVSLPSSTVWQNINAVYDGYSAKIYIDGVLAGESLGSIRPKAVSQTNYHIATGFGTQFAGASPGYFAGQMDDVRIYNRALNQGEITSLYKWSPGKYVHLKMDEKQGSVLYDSSGNQINGTSSGASWVNGKINSGLSLDGINDQLIITNYEFPVVNQFSVNQWFNFQTLAAGKPIISHWGNSANDILIKTSDLASDEISVCIASSGTDNCTNGATTTSADLRARDWNNIHVVYNGTGSANADRLKLYLNGLDQTLSYTGTIPSILQNTSANLEIGGDTDLGVYSNMIADEFTVYHYAQEPEEFLSEYTRGRPVYWWKFAECSGTKIYDSVSGRQGVLSIGSSGTQTQAGDCASSSATSAWYNGRAGVFGGKGINFDGVDDYASTSNFIWPSTKEMSLSFWVYTNSNTMGSPIISQWNGSDNSLLLKMDNSSTKMRICIASSGADKCTNYAQTTDNAFDANYWRHILLTYKGTGNTNADRLKVYINGKMTSLNFTGTIPSVFQNSSDPSLKFAGDPYLSAYANVKLDEIKIWNYILDDFAIKADYNGGEVRFGE